MSQQQNSFLGPNYVTQEARQLPNQQLSQGNVSGYQQVNPVYNVTNLHGNQFPQQKPVVWGDAYQVQNTFQGQNYNQVPQYQPPNGAQSQVTEQQSNAQHPQIWVQKVYQVSNLPNQQMDNQNLGPYPHVLANPTNKIQQLFNEQRLSSLTENSQHTIKPDIMLSNANPVPFQQIQYQQIPANYQPQENWQNVAVNNQGANIIQTPQQANVMLGSQFNVQPYTFILQQQYQAQQVITQPIDFAKQAPAGLKLQKKKKAQQVTTQDPKPAVGNPIAEATTLSKEEGMNDKSAQSKIYTQQPHDDQQFQQPSEPVNKIGSNSQIELQAGQPQKLQDVFQAAEEQAQESIPPKFTEEPRDTTVSEEPRNSESRAEETQPKPSETLSKPEAANMLQIKQEHQQPKPEDQKPAAKILASEDKVDTDSLRSKVAENIAEVPPNSNNASRESEESKVQTSVKTAVEPKYKQDMQYLLNIITADNFDKCKVDLYNLSRKSDEYLKLLVEMIVQKAISEKVYTEFYAEVCSYLSEQYQQDESERPSKDKKGKKKGKTIEANQFRSILYDIVQQIISFKLSIYTWNKDLISDEQTFNIERKKRYVQLIKFMCELYKWKILIQSVPMQCIQELYNSCIETMICEMNSKFSKEKAEQNQQIITHNEQLELMVTLIDSLGKELSEIYVVTKNEKKDESIKNRTSFITELLKNKQKSVINIEKARTKFKISDKKTSLQHYIDILEIIQESTSDIFELRIKLVIQNLISKQKNNWVDEKKDAKKILTREQIQKKHEEDLKANEDNLINNARDGMQSRQAKNQSQQSNEIFDSSAKPSPQDMEKLKSDNLQQQKQNFNKYFGNFKTTQMPKQPPVEDEKQKKEDEKQKKEDEKLKKEVEKIYSDNNRQLEPTFSQSKQLYADHREEPENAKLIIKYNLLQLYNGNLEQIQYQLQNQKRLLEEVWDRTLFIQTLTYVMKTKYTDKEDFPFMVQTITELYLHGFRLQLYGGSKMAVLPVEDQLYQNPEYLEFIYNFVAEANKLTKNQEHKENAEWTTFCQSLFEILKETMVNPVVEIKLKMKVAGWIMHTKVYSYYLHSMVHSPSNLKLDMSQCEIEKIITGLLQSANAGNYKYLYEVQKLDLITIVKQLTLTEKFQFQQIKLRKNTDNPEIYDQNKTLLKDLFEEVYKSIRKDNISQIKLSQIEENMNSIFNEAKDEDKSLIEFK